VERRSSITYSEEFPIDPVFYVLDSQMTVILSTLWADQALHSQDESWYSFYQRLSQPQCHNAAGMIRYIEKSNNLIANCTRGLPASSITPQPATLKRALHNYFIPAQTLTASPFKFVLILLSYLSILMSFNFLYIPSLRLKYSQQNFVLKHIHYTSLGCQNDFIRLNCNRKTL
jgi:hypothetical protein